MSNSYQSYGSTSRTSGENNAAMIFREAETTTSPFQPLTARDKRETADNGCNTGAAQKVTPALTATTAHPELAKEKVKVRKEKTKEKTKVKAKAKEKTKARTEVKIKVKRNHGINHPRAINSPASIGTKANAPKATPVPSSITLLAAFSQPPAVAAQAVNAFSSMLATPRLSHQLQPQRPRPLHVDGGAEGDPLVLTRIKQSLCPPLYAYS